MLLEFSVGNFRSFKERVTFSALADTKIRSFTENIHMVGNLSVLRANIVYGPNAGGKSNFAQAYYSMLRLLRSSFQDENSLSLRYDPFSLDGAMKGRPTYFELRFLVQAKEDAIYRLGFEYTAEKVVREWMYRKALSPKSRENLIYSRDGQTVQAGNSMPDKAVILTIEKQNLLRENTLLFTLLDSLNNSMVAEVQTEFFQKNIAASALYLHKNAMIDESVFEDETLKDAYLYLLRKADTGIEDFKLDDTPLMSKKRNILTAHTVRRGKEQELEYFTMATMESQGTKKIFMLIGVVLTALRDGGVVVIDELDTQLHPLLTRLLFNLFNDATMNLKHAQLVAMTHEHSLLNHPSIRKDQVWFIQKNSGMESELFSLADFKDERSVHSFGKRYMSGQYGAIPDVGDLAFLTEHLFGESQV